MKKLIAAAALVSASSAFAAGTVTTNTYCSNVALETQVGLVNLYITQDGSLDAGRAFTLATYKAEDGQQAAIKGLAVELVKSALFDESTHTNCAWSCFKSESKVYTVKLTIKADETIGSEIQGDVGIPVKQISTYAICTETTTTPVSFK